MTSDWVWIRGLARESGHWGPFVEQFQNAFPDRKVHFLDLPGAGENRNMAPPLTIEEMLPTLRSQFKDKIPAGKAHFLTLSMGAMLGMEWMHKYPEDMHSLVLMNSSSKTHSPFHCRMRWNAYPEFVKALLTSSLRKREMTILKLISNREEVHEEMASIWTRVAQQRPMKVSAFFRQLTAAGRYSPPAQYPASIPVLLLVGLGDRLVEPRCSFDLAKTYMWQIKSHPWAGHDLPIDDPEWVINALREWPPPEK